MLGSSDWLSIEDAIGNISLSSESARSLVLT